LLKQNLNCYFISPKRIAKRTKNGEPYSGVHCAKIYREGIAQSRPTAPRQWPSSAISTTRVAAGSLNEDYPKIVKNPPPAKVKSLLQKYDSITARVVLNLGGHCDFWRHFERHYKVKYGGDDS
jgi:hypothetical protein